MLFFIGFYFQVKDNVTGWSIPVCWFHVRSLVRKFSFHFYFIFYYSFVYFFVSGSRIRKCMYENCFCCCCCCLFFDNLFGCLMVVTEKEIAYINQPLREFVYVLFKMLCKAEVGGMS